MELGALWLGVFLGGIVSGFAGFAFSAVAGAVLLHFFDPVLIIPLMMSCSIISQIATMVALRNAIQWSGARFLLVGGAAGVPLGIALVAHLGSGVVRSTFGLLLVGYAGYLLLRRPTAAITHDGPIVQSAVGFAGGVVGCLTAMPGAVPSIWCELRGSPKELQRGIVQPFIVGMQILALSLLLLMPAGIPKAMPYYLLLSLPALAAGSWAGVLLFGKVDDRAFRRMVLLILIGSGLSLVGWKAWLSL